MTRRGERGQAATEVALTLPIVALLLLAVVQAGLVVHAHVLVVHAAREGAREAAVSSDVGAARRGARAAADLAPERLDVRLTRRAPRVRVDVRYRVNTDVPLIGRLLPDIAVRASATMRSEARTMAPVR